MSWTANKEEVAILLRIDMDPAAQARMSAQMTTLAQEMDRVKASMAEESKQKAADEAQLARLKALSTEATRTQSAWRRWQFAARSMGEVAQIATVAFGSMWAVALAGVAKYVKEAKASDSTIQAWRVSVDRLSTSQKRVSAVFADAMLPLLEKAVVYADMASDFAEKNPDLIRKGLNTVGVMAALSALGVAASKGFKIYADIGYTSATNKQVLAAERYNEAADKALLAANTEKAAAEARLTGTMPAVAGAANIPPAAAAFKAAEAAAINAKAAARKAQAQITWAQQEYASSVQRAVDAKKVADAAVAAAQISIAEMAAWKANWLKLRHEAQVLMTAAGASDASPLVKAMATDAIQKANAAKVKFDSLKTLTEEAANSVDRATRAGAAIGSSAETVEAAQANAILKAEEAAVAEQQLIAARQAMSKEELALAAEQKRAANAAKHATTGLGRALSVLAGIAVGISVYDWIAKKTNRPSAAQMGQQVGSLYTMAEGGYIGGVYGGIKALLTGKNFIDGITIGVREGVKQGFNFGKQLTGLAPMGPAKGTPEYMALFTEQNLPLWQEYYRQVEDATKAHTKEGISLEKEYGEQRNELIDSYEKDRLQAFADYQKDVLRANRDFAADEAATEEEYYYSRSKSAAEFGYETLKDELKHQREMRKLLEEHNDRVEDLAAGRDALGYAREMRDYERRRRDAEEEYMAEQNDRHHSYIVTTREREREFRKEREQRRAQFFQRMADQQQDFDEEQKLKAAQHDIDLANLKTEHDEQIKQLDADYQDQLDMLHTSFQDRLRLIDESIFGDYAAFHARVAKELVTFRAWMNSEIATMGAVPGAAAGRYGPIPQASGGYAGYGIYKRGEEGIEFVLNNRSTRIAERMIGRRLTQENLLAAMLSGGSGGGRYIDQRTMQFNGMTAQDRDWVRKTVTEVSEKVLVDAVTPGRRR